MRYREILPYRTVFTLCLLISIACGQEGLSGGYVGPYGGDIAQYFTDPVFSTNPHQSSEIMYYPYFGAEFFRDYAYPYQFRNGTYPGPYGVYPYYSPPYDSNFGLKSLVGMNWEPFQKEWADNKDNAKTEPSVRAYSRPKPESPAVQIPVSKYIITQSPAVTTSSSTAKIVSQGMRGYQVFLDGNYIGTEGNASDPLDGKFSFSIVGNQNHEIRVFDGKFNNSKTMFFDRGGIKVINVEPELRGMLK